MKSFIKQILELIFSIFKKEEVPIINDLNTNLEEKEETPIIEQVEIKQPENDLKNTSNEVYEMLTIKQRQTYLKKINLYTKSIDGISGSGTKLAIKQFNIIFLNKKSDTYTEETDKLLRKIYTSYCKSKYMVATDWQYFKDFKKSEFYCTCNKKYCDGYNGLEDKIPMHLLMADQYIRNYYGKAVSFSCSIRCPKRNKEVGGVSNSKHIKFRANDLKCKGIKSSQVVSLIYKGANKLPFVNYSYSITTFYTHVDVTI